MSVGFHVPGWIALSSLCWLVAGCELRCSPSMGAPATTASDLQVEISGCAQIPTEHVCELPNEASELTLFSSEPKVNLTLDGHEIRPLSSTRLQEGVRLRVRIPEGSTKLTLDATGRRAHIMLRATRVPARMETLRALRKRGELEELSRALDTWERDLETAKGDPCDRARLLGMRARLAFSQGEPQRADSWYAQSLPQLLACGRLSEAVDDAMAQAYTRSERLRDFAGARAVLDAIAPHAKHYAWGAASIAYHRALLAMRIGRFGRALSLLDEAERGAERLAAEDLRSITLQLRSWVHSLLGQHAQAAESMERAAAAVQTGTPCERAVLLTNLGWQRLLAAEAGYASSADARAPLTESVNLYAGQCGDHEAQVHALINLARVSVNEGHLDEASEHLRRASIQAPRGQGSLQVALLDLRARVLLEADEARAALTVYEELTSRLRAAGQDLSVAGLGRGKALLRLGERERAVMALRESEDELDLQLARVALGAGRESLSADRAESARLLVGTLLELGRPQEAFDAARRARARLFGSLQREALASDDAEGSVSSRERAIGAYFRLRQEMESAETNVWTLPEDEVDAALAAKATLHRQLAQMLEQLFPALRVRLPARAPTEGELVLGIFPFGAQAFLFLQTADTVSARRFDSSQAIAGVLEDASKELLKARSITVIAPSQGAFARIHDAPLGEGKLGLSRPLRYALDVPQPPSPQPHTRRVFVFDPRSDLEGARAEAGWFAERLAKAPQTVWIQGREATRERVLSTWADAALFHYAGHAGYDDQAWWESSLTLAQHTNLTVSDILAAPRVPNHVVLAACATAKAPEARHLATLGIAQAFIAAGAQDVVATLSRVDDGTAFAFTRAYYERENDDPAERLHRSALALQAQGLDPSAFVLLVH